MKREKINFKEMTSILSRGEMRQIVAGSQDEGCIAHGKACNRKDKCCDDSACPSMENACCGLQNGCPV